MTVSFNGDKRNALSALSSNVGSISGLADDDRGVGSESEVLFLRERSEVLLYRDWLSSES